NLPSLSFIFLFDRILLSFFFFQAEDGIRDRNVTGVQTCALRSPDACDACAAIAFIFSSKSLVTSLTISGFPRYSSKLLENAWAHKVGRLSALIIPTASIVAAPSAL